MFQMGLVGDHLCRCQCRLLQDLEQNLLVRLFCNKSRIINQKVTRTKDIGVARQPPILNLIFLLIPFAFIPSRYFFCFNWY